MKLRVKLWVLSSYVQILWGVSNLGWLYILSNGFLLAIGFLGWFFLTGIGVFAGVDSGNPAAASIMTIIATTGLVFFGLLALPGLLAGIGLLKRKSWARILSLVVGFFNLFNFPLGTALALYTFWVLLQDDGEYFIVPKAI